MIGVRELDTVRVMIFNEMPLPSDPELRQLGAQSSLIMLATAGMTFGYGIVVKNRNYNRHLIAHSPMRCAPIRSNIDVAMTIAIYLPRCAVLGAVSRFFFFRVLWPEPHAGGLKIRLCEWGRGMKFLKLSASDSVVDGYRL
jgi:hypothetical protein